MKEPSADSPFSRHLFNDLQYWFNQTMFKVEWHLRSGSRALVVLLRRATTTAAVIAKLQLHDSAGKHHHRKAADPDQNHRSVDPVALSITAGDDDNACEVADKTGCELEQWEREQRMLNANFGAYRGPGAYSVALAQRLHAAR